MHIAYNHSKVTDIMVNASAIMPGQDKCIEPSYSCKLLGKAWNIYKAIKHDNPSGCDEYLSALALGEAWQEGHPWNRENAEHYVSQMNHKRFMNKKKGL